MIVPSAAERELLRGSVVAFYAYETALLDDGKFDDWLELLDDDVRYVMPMRETHEGAKPATALPEFYLFNDDKPSLVARVARLATGLAPSATPPPATQRLVTDVLLEEVRDDELRVRSSLLVYVVRDNENEAFFIGRRTDRLRRDGERFRIAQREIVLAHYVLPTAISVFF